MACPFEGCEHLVVHVLDPFEGGVRIGGPVSLSLDRGGGEHSPVFSNPFRGAGGLGISIVSFLLKRDGPWRSFFINPFERGVHICLSL